MHEATELLLSFTLQTALSFLVVLLDEARLGPTELARSWPPASRASAIVGFGGIVAVPLHFLRTRRNLVGAGLALAGFAGLLAANVALDLVLSVIFGDSR